MNHSEILSQFIQDAIDETKRAMAASYAPRYREALAHLKVAKAIVDGRGVSPVPYTPTPEEIDRATAEIRQRREVAS